MAPLTGIRRIVFRQISDADIRSAQARANVATTGGGARDLRFAHAEVGPVLRAMLPNTRTESRRRAGQMVDETVHYGELHYYTKPDNGRPAEHRTVTIDYESRWTGARTWDASLGPTRSRPINRPPDLDKGSVFAMFLEDEHGDVWFHYVYEQHLRTPGKWHEEIVKTILGCLDDPKRRQNKLAEGYHDLTRNKRYCHL